MAGLDDLIAQIPVADIASKLGADQGEVSAAIQQLVPALVGGLQVNAEKDADAAGNITAVAEQHAASGLLDGGVNVHDVDEADGDKAVARIFGGNDSASVASALAGGNTGLGGGLVQKLLPILAPIVLAYIGKQFAGQNAPAAGGAQAGAQGGGGLGDVLGSILGGATGGGSSNPLGSILGSVLGGGNAGGNNPLGEILGGLLGGKR